MFRSRAGRNAISSSLLVITALVAGCTGAPPSGEALPPDGVASNPGGHADPALVALAVLPPGNGNVTGHTAAAIDDQRARYDAVEHTLYVAPRIKGDFQSFLCTATGYGTVGVKDGKAFCKVVRGAIPFERIAYTPR